MEERNLDYSVFENILNRLNETFKLYSLDKTDLVVRDALIQRFEYTFSVFINTLQQYMKLIFFDVLETENMSFNALIRQANKKELLLNDIEKWDVYRKQRNLTSYAYDEENALGIVSIIDDFYLDAKYLLEQIKRRVDEGS